MKNIKPLKKTLSLSKQTIRALSGQNLDRVAGAIVFPTDQTQCQSFCGENSCWLC
jgi:hypothetical protein